MKKVFLFIFIFGISSFLFAQQVQSGTFRASNTDKGYMLHMNEGTRTYSMEVTFSKPFDVKPEIIISINILDVDHSTPVRYDVSSSAVSRDGFVINFKTWGNTKILNIGGSWLAVTKE